jgi:MFS family permease
MTGLCVSAAFMNAAMATGSVTSTLVAGDRLGAAWGAVPNTAGIIGTGVGALALSRLTDRRVSFVLGYAAAMVGAGLAVSATVGGRVVLLCLGMLLLGLGNAGAQLSRYAAADLYPVRRRGFAIGVLVWCSAIGAIGGPLLLDPAGRLAGSAGLVTLAGPFVLALVTCAIAAVAAFGAPRGSHRAAAVTLASLARTPVARAALTVMATAQVVMVAVMTATPLNMHLHGEGLGSVGVMLAGHTMGMFALSPVTGRLVDRWGPRPVMFAGLLTLAASTALAPMATAVGLFLLGYGWNLCFVGGSSLLVRDLPETGRAQLEGAVDAAVWSIAAVAGLISTPLLSLGGFSVLAWSAGTLALCALGFTLRGAARAPSPRSPADLQLQRR